MSKRFKLINFLNAHDKFRDNEQCVEFDSFEAERTLNHYYGLLVEKDQRIAELEEQLKNKQEKLGCIKKEEKISFMSWDKVEKMVKNEHFLADEIGFMGFSNIYKISVEKENVYIYSKDIDDMFWEIIFSKPLTRENYTKACRKAKELFLGGKNE